MDSRVERLRNALGRLARALDVGGDVSSELRLLVGEVALEVRRVLALSFSLRDLCKELLALMNRS